MRPTTAIGPINAMANNSAMGFDDISHTSSPSLKNQQQVKLGEFID